MKIMSRFASGAVLVLLLAPVPRVGLAAESANAAERNDVLSRLEEGTQIAVEEVHRYYVGPWSKASTAERLRFAQAALKSPLARINWYGLIAAEQLVVANPALGSSLPVTEIYAMTKAEEGDVRGRAVRTWYLLEQGSAEAQRRVSQMLDREYDEAVVLDLVKVAALNGLTAEETASLLRVAKRRPISRVSFHAARTLAWQSTPTTDALPSVIEHIESDLYFADASLLQTVPKFGATAFNYLERLENVQRKFMALASTEPALRPIPIYTDEKFISQLLQQTLDQIRHMKPEGRARNG